MKKIILMILVVATAINYPNAQTKDKMINFLIAWKYKNWVGVSEEKADKPNLSPKSNIRFTFYMNGNVTKEERDANGNWNSSYGKWQLYKSEDTWMMKVIGKTYRLETHFADTDEKERLDMLDDEDFQKGRLIHVFTLKANGYE